MKKLILVTLLCAYSIIAISQQLPTQPFLWIKADNQNNGLNVWNDLSGNNNNANFVINHSQPDSALFNFNKAIFVNQNYGKFVINRVPKENNQLTIISVFKPTNANIERGLWLIKFDSTQNSRLTTSRIKSLTTDISYAVTSKSKPTINTARPRWTNQKADSLDSYIYFGSSDSLGFHGKLAEFLIFDKPLSDTALLKTHTYLALKYGISLFKSNYINSAEQVIWNYEENVQYSKEIAGIGKDTILNIDQKQSAADGGENILCISANTKHRTNIENNTMLNQGDFLIWSSNSGNISQTSIDTVHPNQLGGLPDKKWLMQVSGNTSRSIPTQVVLNGSQFDTLGRCFIVIDKSASGNFSQLNSQIIEADSIDANKNIYFSNIYWDTDLSGKDMFTFILGNKLTLFATTYQTSSTTGALDLEVIGGTPPFTYSLFSDSTSNYILWNSDGRTQNKQNLLGGTYIAKVLDIKGNTDFQPIEITISENTTSYSCTPKKLLNFNNTNNTTEECKIFPNPSNGNYTISITQSEITPVEIKIFDDLGKLIDYKKESGSSRYTINGHLDVEGNYLIEIVTNKENRFYKLVII
jgi:hypothetical protein